MTVLEKAWEQVKDQTNHKRTWFELGFKAGLAATVPAPPTDDIKAVFTHWQTTHAKPASKLDAKRTSRIRTMLKTFDVEQLCRAIDGSLKDDWLCGRDPKSAGKKYNGIETILRDAGQIERLIDLAGPRRVSSVAKPAWDFPLVQVGEVIKDGRA
jgi:hypothetical protein